MPKKKSLTEIWQEFEKTIDKKKLPKPKEYKGPFDVTKFTIGELARRDDIAILNKFLVMCNVVYERGYEKYRTKAKEWIDFFHWLNSALASDLRMPLRDYFDEIVTLHNVTITVTTSNKLFNQYMDLVFLILLRNQFRDEPGYLTEFRYLINALNDRQALVDESKFVSVKREDIISMKIGKFKSEKFIVDLALDAEMLRALVTRHELHQGIIEYATSISTASESKIRKLYSQALLALSRSPQRLFQIDRYWIRIIYEMLAEDKSLIKQKKINFIYDLLLPFNDLPSE